MSQQHLPISLWLRLCRWLWKYPLRFLFSTLIINVAINIGSTWLITPATTKAIPDTSSLGNITGWVSAHWVYSLFLGTISIMLLLVTWRGSRESEPMSSGPTQIQMSTRDREHMIKRLCIRYEQLLAQSLQGAVEIELGLVSRPAAIQNAVSLSLRLPEQPEQALPVHTSIIDAYELAQQELLILGEPGAGKSTLLLELAQHLVKQAEQDDRQLLPVLLPLSSWAVKHSPLQEWLIEQFAQLYEISRKISASWIQGALILPLLDGLDEMDEAARPACIEAINTYHREHLCPLVVCSRTQEYDTAALYERLVLHTAVVVQPILPEQVDAHLVTLGKPLVALRSALKKNPMLAELARAPLMLQILILTYHGTTARQLFHKQGVLRSQIWTDYVQHMIERKKQRENSKNYPFDRTIIWLSWLARYMRDRNQTIFSLEYLQPNALPKKYTTFYHWSLALIFGLIGALFSTLFFNLVVRLFFELDVNLLKQSHIKQIVGPMGITLNRLFYSQLYGLLNELARGIVGSLIFGLVGTLIFGLVGGLLNRLFGNSLNKLFNGLTNELEKIEPREIIHVSWKDLMLGIGFGLLFVPFLLVASGLQFELPVRLLMGLLSGVLIGLFLGIDLEQLAKDQTLSPNEGIQRSLKNGFVFLLAFGLFMGLLAGLLFGLLFGLLLGLLVGLLMGMIFGLLPVVQHYTLRFWLWRSHLFPLKAVPFLEDANSRILLRRVGGGYSFTHRLLLDYFADLPTTPPAPSSGPHPVPPPSTP